MVRFPIRARARLYLGDLRDAEGSREKEARLKLLQGLIFTVSYTTYWQIPRLCKFLCPLKWLRADNETTLCVLTCTIAQRTEEILQGMRETKTNTSFTCCKLCLKMDNPWSKPMERALCPLCMSWFYDSAPFPTGDVIYLPTTFLRLYFIYSVTRDTFTLKHPN